MKYLTWEQAYEYAKKYYQENGHLEIPKEYIMDEFYLGYWIQFQRNSYRGTSNSSLSKEQIKKLNQIHMIWYPRNYTWHQYYLLAKNYYQENGNLLIPQNYKVDGKSLGMWINNNRQRYKNQKLTKKQIHKLNQIHMVWNTYDLSWNDYYQICDRYYQEFHNLDIPQNQIYMDVNLGKWINRQRILFNQGKLSYKRICKLNQIHMIWNKYIQINPKNIITEENQNRMKIKMLKRMKHVLEENIQFENISDVKELEKRFLLSIK